MRNLLMQLVREFGNGRALANARREQDEVQLTLARVDDLGRRLAPVVASAA